MSKVEEKIPELNFCKENKLINLQSLISKINGISLSPEEMKQLNEKNKILSAPRTKVKLSCNWATPKDLCNQWNKMSKGNYTWDTIQATWEEDYDYLVIINYSPEHINVCPQKTILFEMNPDTEKFWKDNKISTDRFMKVFAHSTDHNNVEWTLKYTYSELAKTQFNLMKKGCPTGTSVSIVLPYEYREPGHIKKIDFAKYFTKYLKEVEGEKKTVSLDVFGCGNWGLESKRNMTDTDTDDALINYRYTIAVENKFRKNLFTEKLINGILSETLVFYHGCYNIREFIDPRAYVYLEFSNLRKDSETIISAITSDLYTERLPYILEAKKKILNELQFFPRLEKFLQSQNNNKDCEFNKSVNSAELASVCSSNFDNFNKQVEDYQNKLRI